AAGQGGNAFLRIRALVCRRHAGHGQPRFVFRPLFCLGTASGSPGAAIEQYRGRDDCGEGQAQVGPASRTGPPGTGREALFRIPSSGLGVASCETHNAQLGNSPLTLSRGSIMRLIGIYSMVLSVACIAGSLGLDSSDAGKQNDAISSAKLDGNTWVKIVSGLLTTAQSKQGLHFQENSIVKPYSMCTFAAKDLGAKLSLKMIQEKYGKPSKTAEYRTKLGEKILTLKEYHYPPIFFVAEKDSDDVFLISAPKRLWSRPGMLENARAALADEKKDGQSSGKLDGKWHVVRQEEHGNLVPAIVSKRLSMVIDGDKMEWYIGNPAPNFAATITIDEEKKTIDAKIT